MADSISRDAVMELFDWWEHEYDEIDNYIRNMRQDVLTLPTIEAEPKSGRWIRRGDNSWECSECHEISCCKGNYCVDCGARMDEVGE